MIKINRHIKDNIIKSLGDFPIVFILGPKSSGKTTLVKQIVGILDSKVRYITFDDIKDRLNVKYDPETFLLSIDDLIILDELALPEVFLSLKNILKEKKGNGKFLIISSVRGGILPKLSNDFIQKIAFHPLPTLSSREIKGENNVCFITKAFTQNWQIEKNIKYDDISIMQNASFPELLKIKNIKRRNEWCESYINNILQSDIPLLMGIEKKTQLLDMIKYLANHSGSILNEASLARNSTLNHITAKRYRQILEGIFITQIIPAWSADVGKRLIKAPKIYMGDINILTYLLNVNLSNLPQENHILFTKVLENFVAIELSKQIFCSATPSYLYHYRTTSGSQVNFIMESQEKKVVGIQVIGKRVLVERDFQSLVILKNNIKQKFQTGIVLYCGNDIISFDNNICALPLRILWN